MQIENIPIELTPHVFGGQILTVTYRIAGGEQKHQVTNTEIAILVAAKLKANDGLKRADLPRNFRAFQTMVLRKNLLKPRNKNNNRFVLTDLGKSLLNSIVSHVRANTEKTLVPIATFEGKVTRKQFYHLFYFVIDNYGFKKSRDFNPLDRLSLNKLFNEKIAKSP